MRTEKATFYSEGIKLSGGLYLPDSDQGKPYAGIVQGPGFLGLKDAKHYIMMFEKLCEAGYASHWIANLMGHTGRQLADGCQAFAVHEFALHELIICNVFYQDDAIIIAAHAGIDGRLVQADPSRTVVRDGHLLFEYSGGVAKHKVPNELAPGLMQ